MENTKKPDSQMSFSELMMKCDEILKEALEGNADSKRLEELKIASNTIGRKQRLVATQLQYISNAGIDKNKEDFDFVYASNK